MDVLELRDNAKHQLQQIKTIETGVEYLNKVKAIETWAKAEKKDADLQNMIAEQKIRTQRILGQLLKDSEIKGGDRKSVDYKSKSDTSTLISLGITKDQSSTFQKIAALPEEIFEAEIATAKAETEKLVELTTSRMVTAAKEYEQGKKMTQHVDATNNIGDEWYTPKWLFDSLGLQFDIDVCSPVNATHSNVPALKRFNINHDGLAQPWNGLVWCNPPYSSAAPWAEKMIAHGNGLLLSHIPMNALWAAQVWQQCDGVRLIQAMEFVRPDGSKERPGYWLMIAAFGEVAGRALEKMIVPDEIHENPRRVPSPYLKPIQ